MNYNRIRKYISEPRLRKYLDVCNGDTERALKLYQTNLRLSQAFYPILSLFEVVLRNAINEEIERHFNDKNWLVNQKKGFMAHSSLTYYDPRLKKTVTNNFLQWSVAKAQKELGPSVTTDKIVANLKLGFWTALFNKTHFKILSGRPIAIFTKCPKGVNRLVIYDKIMRIKDFRNRIYHNEPVIFVKKNGRIEFSTRIVVEVYNELKDIFTWLDLDFDCWTRKINSVTFERHRAECVHNHYPSTLYYILRLQIGFHHYLRKYFGLK